MCLNVFGVQAVTVWQWLQSKLFTGNVMWPTFGPVAYVPLWQFLHPPVIVLWSTLAGSQASVEWQEPHSCVVGTWPTGLPAAFTPSWQLLQTPSTCLWSTWIAGFQAVVVWQASQAVSEAMCVALLPVAMVPL